MTSAPLFPSGAELLLALPGVKRTVEGRARRAAFADRSCACLFMQRNSWGFGESFKDEDGCTSCMAFSSGRAFCIWPLTKGLINPPACCQALNPPLTPPHSTKRLLFEQILPGVTLPVLHHLKGQAQQMAEKTLLSMTIKLQLTTKQDDVLTLDVIGRLATSILNAVDTPGVADGRNHFVAMTFLCISTARMCFLKAIKTKIGLRQSCFNNKKTPPKQNPSVDCQSVKLVTHLTQQRQDIRPWDG